MPFAISSVHWTPPSFKSVCNHSMSCTNAANSGHVTHPRYALIHRDHITEQVHIIPVRRNSILRRLPRNADHCLTRGLTNNVRLSTDWCTRDYVSGEGRHTDAIETGRQTETERKRASNSSLSTFLSKPFWGVLHSLSYI